MANTKPQKEERESPTIDRVPLNTNVWVYSNSYGQLIYISKKTGFRVDWDNFGAKQNLSLEELIVMRNTQRKFFSNNLIRIKGFVEQRYDSKYSVEDILGYLQVKDYYKNSLCPESLDDLFRMSPNEIIERLGNLSTSTKNSVVVRANELIMNGTLDSLSVISAIEKTINCDLTRP
jgi:hypothetical protein